MKKEEVFRAIEDVKKINEIDRKIKKIEKKNPEVSKYDKTQLGIFGLIIISTITGILTFFLSSKHLIGVDLGGYFFESGNYLLSTIVIILTVFSSFEFAYFIFEITNFNQKRNKYRKAKWNDVYIDKVKKLKVMRTYIVEDLKKTDIPEAYVNLEALLFFKEELEKTNIQESQKLIELYRTHMLKIKEEKIVEILKKTK